MKKKLYLAPIVVLLIFLAFPIIFLLAFKKNNISPLLIKQQDNNKPTAKIKTDLLLPFCETRGNITNENIASYFGQWFINFHNSRQTEGTPKDIAKAREDNHTALSAAKERYDSMFEKKKPDESCTDFIKNITNESLEIKRVRNDPKNVDSDYIYTFSPAKGIKIEVPIIFENNQPKMATVYYSATVILPGL